MADRTGSSARQRYAAALAMDRNTGGAPVPPPGVDREMLRLAMLEDTYEALEDLQIVTAALVLCPPDQPAARAVTWPGTPVVGVESTDPPETAAAALAALAELGAEEAAIVAGDAPDLPPMLLGKLYQGLEHADVAVCPARDGGLVALAARLSLASWVTAARVGLGTPEALTRLRHAAPARRALSVSPGWHRLRTPDDVHLLDPGLEGWDATRALLSGRPL